MNKQRKMRFWLYKIYNNKNNKLYIGITTQENPNRRWGWHKSDARNKGKSKHRCDYPLYRSMRKHGIDNFFFEIIKEYKSLEEVKNAEIEFIKKYKSNNKKFGYNLTGGGEGLANCGPKIRKKLSNAVKKRIKDGTFNNPNKGKFKFTPEIEEEICKKYLSGDYTTTELRKIYNCARTTLVKLFRKMNIRAPKKYMISKEGDISKRKKISKANSGFRIAKKSKIFEVFEKYENGEILAREAQKILGYSHVQNIFKIFKMIRDGKYQK